MPTQRKPKPAARAKERDGACKLRRPQARKRVDRPSRGRAATAPGCLPEMARQARHRERAVLPPASPPLVMWKVYEHPKDSPAEYVARNSSLRKIFTGPPT